MGADNHPRALADRVAALEKKFTTEDSSSEHFEDTSIVDLGARRGLQEVAEKVDQLDQLVLGSLESQVNVVRGLTDRVAELERQVQQLLSAQRPGS